MEEKGIIRTTEYVVRNVSLDAIILLSHPNQEDFGVLRVHPRDVNLPHVYTHEETVLRPFFERYSTEIKRPLEQIAVTLFGGEYEWNEILDQILVSSSQDNLRRRMEEYFEQQNFGKVRYFETDKNAIKTIIVKPYGRYSVKEEIPELNTYEAQMTKAQLLAFREKFMR